MPTYPLIYVRAITRYPVPSVPTIYWTEQDWNRIAVRTCEPLVIEMSHLGRWLATGERNAKGQLLYKQADA